ncbi:MAG: Na+/proline symporter, partial [Dehalococcoidia bacterium]
DLPRLRPHFQGALLLRSSRVITALLVLPAIAVGYAFDSVLYLFFIADLVCAGAVVPVFAGMFSRRLSGTGAAVGAIAGILAGALFFPTPSLAGWWTFEPLTNVWHILASGNLLGSFLVALVVSTVTVAGFILAGSRERQYDFRELSASVHLLKEGA